MLPLFPWYVSAGGGSLCSFSVTYTELTHANQQACVRPCCFTGRARPLGTGFFDGSMVLSIDLFLPPLRFLTYGFLAAGSPRLTAFSAPLSPAKLPVSYPFFLSSPCTDFDPTDFCHLRRRTNYLICSVANFWPG